MTVFFSSVLVVALALAGYYGPKIRGAENTFKEQSGKPYDCFMSRLDWGARNPSSPLEDTKRPLSLVIILHTAVSPCTTSIQCITTVKNFQAQAIDVQNFSDVHYNFLVGGDGKVYEGRGWGKVAGHTYGYNTKSVGIAFIGNYHNMSVLNNIPTPQQINCTQELLKNGVEEGWLAPNYDLVGFCDLKGIPPDPEIPPGNNLVKEIRTWEHYRHENNPGICKDT